MMTSSRNNEKNQKRIQLVAHDTVNLLSFLAAKDFVLKIMLKGLQSPCDVSITEDSFQLPAFYDDEKFKRYVI
jgi:hypothetical protein